MQILKLLQNVKLWVKKESGKNVLYVLSWMLLIPQKNRDKTPTVNVYRSLFLLVLSEKKEDAVSIYCGNEKFLFIKIIE